jgi:two-component system, chemotaxis family, CheB/CheR fusion protein
MPQCLLNFWANAKEIRLSDVSGEEGSDTAPAGAFSENNERALREIMIILRTRTAHDFRHYKRATVLRRIERRLQVNGFSDLQQYRDHLHLHPEETVTLLQDMLISVTNFFRDKDAYEALRKEVLPVLFRNRTAEEPIRVWAAGCATGEEAYSVAMLLQEASTQTSEHVPFQVFVTDIDERAINVARDGLYAESILADVDLTRMQQYFTKEGSHYRIKRELPRTRTVRFAQCA